MYEDYNNTENTNGTNSTNNMNNTNNTNNVNSTNNMNSMNGSDVNNSAESNGRYGDYTSYSEVPTPNGTDRDNANARESIRGSYINAGSTGNNAANSTNNMNGTNNMNNSYQYGQGSNGTGYSKPHYTSYQYTGAAGAGAHIPPENNSSNNNNKKKKPMGFFKKAVMCVALGLIFGLCAGGSIYLVNSLSGNGNGQVASTQQAAPVTTVTASADTAVADSNAKKITTTTAATTSNTVTDVSSVASDVMPAVVAITNDYTATGQDWFGQQVQQESEASGSGIIVGENDKELLIATNNHVVSEADKLSVQFIDGSKAEANLKGGDEDADIAVIAVALDSLSDNTINSIKIATLGDSDALTVGEPAIAIGNALGYGQSVTSGVISALNREVTLDNGTHKLIQTDAAINPGNSGGALLNTKGELIGINEAKAGGSDVEGMGYAIPISTAKPIIDELMNKETKTKVDESEQAYLGIGGVDVTSDVASTYNMPEGIYIAQVEEGSAAANAGMIKGDIITKFDGQTVGSMEDLKDLMQYYKAGQTVDVTMQVQDAGGYAEKQVSVTLGKRTAQESN